MTSSDTVERLLLVLAGWLLSSATTFTAYLVKRRRDRRKLFTRTFSAVEAVFLDLEIIPALRQAGAIESLPGLLGVDESWRYLIPPVPPDLPRDFKKLISDVAEWEAIRGEATLTRQLASFQSTIGNLNALHTGLAIQARAGAEHISPRASSLFNTLLADLRKQCQLLLTSIQPHRLGTIARLGRSFRVRRRGRDTASVSPAA